MVPGALRLRPSLDRPRHASCYQLCAAITPGDSRRVTLRRQTGIDSRGGENRTGSGRLVPFMGHRGRCQSADQKVTGSSSKKTPPKKTSVSDRWNHYTFRSVLASSSPRRTKELRCTALGPPPSRTSCSRRRMRHPSRRPVAIPVRILIEFIRRLAMRQPSRAEVPARNPDSGIHLALWRLIRGGAVARLTLLPRTQTALASKTAFGTTAPATR